MLRRYVFFTVGLICPLAVLASLYASRDYEYQFEQTVYGRVSCKVTSSVQKYQGRNERMLSTLCEPPAGLTPKTHTREMSFVGAAAYASDGQYLKCVWIEYRVINFWPPYIESFHNFEDCELVRQT